MASNEYIQGYWLDKSGKWSYKARATWKKDNIGWYYIDSNGWYAKNGKHIIDSTSYIFNEAGYLYEYDQMQKDLANTKKALADAKEKKENAYNAVKLQSTNVETSYKNAKQIEESFKQQLDITKQ